MPRPLAITILQGAFFPVPPVRGGAVEKLWHQLGIEFARQGHQVTQISRAVPELPAEGVADGVRHIRVAGYDQPAGGLALKARDLLYTRRALRRAPAADILVTNTFFAPLLAPRRLGRIVVSVERMPKGQMRLYRRASRLRACSQAVGEAIAREAPGLAGRIVVIPNPLPFVPDRPAPPAAARHGVLYVGRIHPAKGLELLLAAFARAKQRGLLPAAARLTLAGPAAAGRGGGGEAWWRAQLDRHGGDDVRWLGPVYDAAALNELYREARVFAYPTLDEAGEAMPLAPLEAMAWGAVPVVSDLACFRDYIRPGENGVVFDHRGPGAEERLAAALGAAADDTAAPLAARAPDVRSTHAAARIAERFLEEFTRVVGDDSAK